MTSGIDQYMCKLKCPCDPRGLNNLNKWSLDQQKQFTDKEIYFFNGTYVSYFQCYQDLVAKDIIDEKYKLPQKTLAFI